MNEIVVRSHYIWWHMHVLYDSWKLNTNQCIANLIKLKLGQYLEHFDRSIFQPLFCILFRHKYWPSLENESEIEINFENVFLILRFDFSYEEEFQYNNFIELPSSWYDLFFQDFLERKLTNFYKVPEKYLRVMVIADDTVTNFHGKEKSKKLIMTIMSTVSCNHMVSKSYILTFVRERLCCHFEKCYGIVQLDNFQWLLLLKR